MKSNNLACFVLAVGNERDQREDSASPELFSTPPEDQGISDNKVFNQQTDIFFGINSHPTKDILCNFLLCHKQVEHDHLGEGGPDQDCC